MATQIFKTKQEKAPFYKGINQTAEIIGSTLGAAGNTVIMSLGHGSMPVITKDGVSVARPIMYDDELECMGGTLLKDAANKTVDATGDGTTSTVILANAMVNEGLKEIENGAKPQFIKEGIQQATKMIAEHLKENSEQIDSNDEKALSVATISANNDPELGGIIADAYKKIGKNGLLTVDFSSTIETYSKVVDGFEFNRGYMHKYFANTEKLQTIFINPLIMVADYTISKFKQIQDIAEKMLATQRPIVIIATDYEAEAYGTILQNKMKGILNICLIKAPNVYKKDNLDDIAVLTGATVIRDDAGLKLESTLMNHIGGCDKIIVDDRKTTIISGHGKKELIEKRKNEINTIIENSDSDPEYKKVVEKRLAALSGSVGVIYAGAMTEVEAKEKYDRIDDAIKAVKSALEEGISCGGGIALVRATESLNKYSDVNPDVQKGIEIVGRAALSPFVQLLSNAGKDREEILIILAKVLEQGGNVGVNIKTGDIEDLKKAGIIDPTKVIRVALENAASLAATILGSEYLLVEMKERKG